MTTSLPTSATEIKEAFLKGQLSSVDITKAYLDNIALLDSKVGAFLSLFPEKALEKAKKLDEKRKRKEPLGHLASVPVAIKDNIHIQGELTTCASRFLANYKAPFSATVTHLLEREDAIILGKTNLDEFAMGSSTENSAFQKTKNPWDLTCVPGGSSGGSAAAVAARQVPIALGSDTGGSIRQPASFCGVVGFKPTYGRVSRFGLVAFASSLDQIGPLAVNTKDAALAMEVIGAHCRKDATSLPYPNFSILNGLKTDLKGVSIGVPWGFLQGLSKEPKDNFERSLSEMKALGAQLVEVDLSALKYSLAVYYILATAEASTNLARFDGIRYGVRSPLAKTLDEVYDLSKEEGFGREVKRRILLGTYVLSAGYQDAYYKKAEKVRSLIIQQYKEAFKLCTLIATPVSPFTAFPIGAIQDPLQMYLEDIYTISINLAGLPAISLPNGFSQTGKPFGLQLIGNFMDDATVLQCAHAFEQFTPYHKKRPTLLQESECYEH